MIKDCYEKRKLLLKNIINKMNFDIGGFQEVSFKYDNQLKDIFEKEE